MTESVSMPIPSAFDQLVEIHPITDTYRILYLKKYKSSPLERAGSFSQAIQYMSRNCVHPGDVQSFMLTWDPHTLYERLTRFENIRGITSEFRLQRQDGSLVWIEDYIVLSDDAENDPVIMCYSKASSRPVDDDAAEQTIGQPAKINMYRETEFFMMADLWIEDAYAKNLAAFAIDIDYFKLYNDIYGRVAGNRLLTDTSEMLLRLSQGKGGIAGYLGGDNFCIILPYDEEDDREFRSRLISRLKSFQQRDAFSMSFGICICKPGEFTSMEMYDRALIALSHVKNDYNKQSRFYAEGDLKRLRAEQILMIDAEKALKDNEFIFYLQPKVDIHTGLITSAEALVRWKKGNEIISPGAFIDVLEKSGYIFSLDKYIWEAVCKFQRSLMDQGITPLPISVNVSRLDFHFGDIADYFISLVKKYAILPEYIQVEVTESAYAQDTDEILKCCEKLHEAGFIILMDDFGSGYSSLNSLKSMYIDILKIDKRFLDFESTNDTEHSIVSTIINMAHMLGILVVTEGVETREQVTMLSEMNCNYVQGYFYYKPMPVEDYTELIRDEANVSREKPTLRRTRVGRLKIDELISQKLVDNNLVNHLLGPCAIFESFEGNVQILQQNDEYTRLTGRDLDDEYSRLHVAETSVRGREYFLNMLEDAKAYPKDGLIRMDPYWLKDGSEVMLYTRTFPISETGGHSFFLVQIRRMDESAEA